MGRAGGSRGEEEGKIHALVSYTHTHMCMHYEHLQCIHTSLTHSHTHTHTSKAGLLSMGFSVGMIEKVMCVPASPI